jgi:hypothetical protein
LEELIASTLPREEYFVVARAKLNVTKLATDKVFLPVTATKSIIVFVHYEKVQQICTNCASFFHNAKDCTLRTTKVMTEAPTNYTATLSFGHHGRWMT